MPELTDRLSAALADRYRLDRHLGEGGMATVYLAHDLKHERNVALKILRPELAAVIGGERFLVEIKTTANLQHPHILPLFDSGEADGFLYYVMPYIEGETLRGKLDKEKQIGVDEALRITRDVADALDYAHRNGVIHRDIKPENILLHDGRPVVADFGIALAISAAGGGRMTETGLSLGTPHYMSPEQATADRDLTARSDQYSLACVAYEMLSGDPPHTGPTAQAILLRILTENPRPVSEVRTAVPPHVVAALAKALEKLPADRFETAKDFAAAMEDETFTYTARTPATGIAAAAPPVRVEPGPAKRGPLMAMGAVAAIALVVAMLGWMRSPPAQLMRLDLSTGAVVPLPQSDVVISRDGSMLAVSGTVDGATAIYLRRIGEADFRMIPGTENGRFPSFSPDGKWIVYRDHSASTLVQVAVDGGGALTLVDDDAIDPYVPHWGADGTIVFSGPQGLHTIPAEGGPPEPVQGSTSGVPYLLPDGSGVLSSGGGVFYNDFAADSSWEVVQEGQHATYLATGHILYVPPSGGLFAVPFDLGTKQVTGPPERVLDRVASNGFARRGYSISDNGTLVQLEGERGVGGGGGGPTRFLLLDRTGIIDTVRHPDGRSLDPRFSPEGRHIAYEFIGSSGNESDIYTYDLLTGTGRQQYCCRAGVVPTGQPMAQRLARSRRDRLSDHRGWQLGYLDVLALRRRTRSLSGSAVARVHCTDLT